ncbi:DUF3126 family protein [Acuticoccus kandeliae]|uniref:DUF3126 family protein n=1 Tax=Acuticoccus kandeliae TaxID=2073160 RepID=UPI003CCB75DF
MAARDQCKSERLESRVKKAELEKLQAYMRRTFANDTLSVRARPRKDDSAEVYLGEEFIGVLYRDEDEGELSWNFTMAILEVDLEGA